ncbi:MAG: GNAT family N-acetyltransferase [Bacteroidia bacterium]
MIEIKKADLSDLEVLTELAQISFIESHGHSAPEKDIRSYVDKSLSLDSFKQELLDQTNNYYILYYNNTPVGFSNIVFNSNDISISEKKVTRLGRLYFLKKFHGLKLGKALFEFNVDLSKQEGQKGVWLYVWAENKPALSFYKKAGFTITREAFFKISEEHSNPNFIMYLQY